ncbi:alpha/beta hydrolase, partial [Francisella tularensis]|uniref:alpha/beta hydrolase n=1 Tax=Francisella tularensis TaxID=263 RepID=UPI002381A732
TKQPDTLIVAATQDILIDCIYAYEEKLKQQGTYVETYYYDEMFHGFMGILGITPFENPIISLNKVIEFINKR